MTSQESRAAWPLSEVVAERVKALRDRAGWNRERLAEACRAIDPGGAMTASVVANVETGRKGANGQRRRDVTVDELVTFGRALGVPPLLLLFPVDAYPSAEVLPGRVMDTWDAARWFSGEGPFIEPTDHDEATAVATSNFDAWRQGGEALDLLRWHDRYLAEWRSERRKAEALRRASERAASPEEAARLAREVDEREQSAREIEDPLRLNRDAIRRRSMPRPTLPDGLAHLDEEPSS